MAQKWPARNRTISDFGPEQTPLDELLSPGEVFHEASKLRMGDRSLYAWIHHVNTSDEVRATISRPLTDYRGAPATVLPTEFATSERSFEQVLTGRRSSRDLSPDPISLDVFAKLLHLSGGITQHVVLPNGAQWALRAAPSGGGLYPIETYVAVFRIEGLTPGLYLYSPQANSVLLLREGDLSDQVAATVPAQAATVRAAAACFVLAACLPRIRFKYGERGYRFALLECGHIAQNMLLVAEAHGLGAVPLGGFMDDPLNQILNLDGVSEAAIYPVAVGCPRDASR